MKACELHKLEEVCSVEYGTRVVQKRDGGTRYPVYGGGGETFRVDSFNREDRLVVARFGMSQACTRFVAGQFFLNDSGLTVASRTSALDQRFLDWQLSALNDEIYALGKGTAQKNLDVPLFRQLPMYIPPLPEQRRIVALLDEAFAGLATAAANAERNLDNARELFESHLAEVFSRRGDGWVETTLGELGATQTGTTPKTSDRANYGDFVPFIKPGDFQRDGTLDYSNEGLSERGLRSARLVAADSILMVCIGATLGKCGYCTRPVTTNQQINALTPVAGVSTLFVYFQMLTGVFQRRARSSAGQATLPVLSKSKWNALPIWLPSSLADQESIAAMCLSLANKAQRLGLLYEQKRTALAELKKSLLHQAFSGAL